MSNANARIIGGAALAVIGGYTGQGWLVRTGVTLALSGAQEALTDDPIDRSGWDFEQKLNARGATQKLGMVFGERRRGGVQFFGASRATGRLYWGVAHCFTPYGVDAITDVWIGDERIEDAQIDANGNVLSGPFEGLVKIHRYRGTADQAADPTLVDLGNTYSDIDWSADHRGRGVAYTLVEALIPATSESELVERFNEEAFPRGWRGNISALIRGERCYDPRLDDTAGGSGTHRIDDPTTWEYTRNPALQSAHYLTTDHLDGGAEYETDTINWDEVAAAANRCDGTITTPDGSLARYRCDIYTDGENHAENLKRFEQAMIGRIRDVRGQWRFKAGGYTAPSEVIDADWLAADAEVSTARELGEIYNSVVIEHPSPEKNWEFVPSQPFTSSLYEEQDNFQRIPRTIKAEGITNPYHAQQLAIVRARQTRDQKVVALACNYMGLLLDMYDTVTLDLPDTAVGSETFEVVEITWAPGEPVMVLLREISESTWTIALEDFEQIAAVTPPVTEPEEVPAPINPRIVGVAGGIEFRWDSPSPLLWDHARVQVADDDGGQPGTPEEAPLQRSGSYFHPGNRVDKWFRVRLEAIGSTPSEWSAWVNGASAEAGRQYKSIDEPNPADGLLIGDIWVVMIEDPATQQAVLAGWRFQWDGEEWGVLQAWQARGEGKPTELTGADGVRANESPPGSVWVQTDPDFYPSPDQSTVMWGKEQGGTWVPQSTGGSPPGWRIGGRESGRVIRAVEDSPGSAGQAGREHDDRTGIGGYGSVPLPHLPIWSGDGMDELLNPVERKLKSPLLGPDGTGVADIEDGGNRGRAGLSPVGAVDQDVPRGFAVAQVPAISTTSGRTRKVEPYDEGDSQIGTADPVASLSNGADVEDGADRARGGLTPGGVVDLDVPLTRAVANVPAVSPTTGRVRKTEPYDGSSALPIGTDDEVSSLTDGAAVKADAEDGKAAKTRIDTDVGDDSLESQPGAHRRAARATGAAGQESRESDDRLGLGGWGSTRIPTMPVFSSDGMSVLLDTANNRIGSDLAYPNGTKVETLQPNEGGADKTSQHTSYDTARVDGRAAATVKNEARTGKELTDAGSGSRLGDLRNSRMGHTGNVGSLQDGYTNDLLGAGYNSNEDWTVITIKAHNLRLGGETIAYDSASVYEDGQLEGQHYVYAQDPNYQGGAVTYQVTASRAAVVGHPDRYFVGSIDITAGGGSGGGGGGDGGIIP